MKPKLTGPTAGRVSLGPSRFCLARAGEARAAPSEAPAPVLCESERQPVSLLAIVTKRETPGAGRAVAAPRAGRARSCVAAATPGRAAAIGEVRPTRSR